MSANDSDRNEVLDWTMTAAPTAEELAEAPPPLPGAHPSTHPNHPRHFSRWMWLTLGGLTLTVLLSLMVFSWGNKRQVAADVQNVFLAEEEAAQARDARALTALTARGYTDWLNTRLLLAQHNLAAPAPALLFNPSPQAGDIISLTTFAPDIMQVDLQRAYTGPGGETTHFASTQFYQYQQGWKRTPTPPYFSGELRQFVGRRLTIIYFEHDADLITTLGPYLDGLLESACAEWACADTFTLSLQFLEATPAFEPNPTTDQEPLVFRMLAYTNTTWLDASPLNLPAPHIVGTPADDTSRLAFQRVLGQQVLLYAVQRFITEVDGPTRNALAYALVARLAVRLKLEAPATLTIAQTTLATDVQALWDLRAVPIWDQIPRRQLALRSALGVLRVLLQDQPLTAEQALFQQLHRRNTSRGWLADGLGIDYADVQAALARAGRATLSAQLPPGAEPTLALQCVSGPQLYFEADNQTLPFITGPFFDAQISGWPWRFTGNTVWSPDGNYLLLSISGQSAVLNLTQHALNWMGVSGNGYTLLPRGWVSDTVVAYLDQSEVRFLDILHPENRIPSFPATDYVLAPDGRRAALVWDQAGGRNNGLITMLTPESADLLAVDAGFTPVWMEAGRVLVYGQYQNRRGQSSIKLRQAEIVNGIRYTVQEGDSMWSIVANHNTSFDDVWTVNQMTTNLILPGQVLVIPIQDSDEQVVVTHDIVLPDNSTSIAWGNTAYLTSSADGETLAVVLEGLADQPASLMLVNLAGSLNTEISLALFDTAVGNPERLLRADPNTSRLQFVFSDDFRLAMSPRFSADGDYLAALVEEDGLPTLKIYRVDSGRPVFSQPNSTSYAWSPTGHRLAVTTDHGAFIVNDTLQSTGSSTAVTPEQCQAVWWRPQE